MSSSVDRRSGLAARLGPRDEDSRSPRRWRIETAVLIIAGILLLVMSINDTSRQTIVNERLKVDLVTWSHFTGLDTKEPAIEQGVFGYTNTIDVVCGNLKPGPPESTVRQCAVITGPDVHGLRHVIGGYRLPAYSDDEPARRFDCYGEKLVTETCRR
jgi:hypothetical protein